MRVIVKTSEKARIKILFVNLYMSDKQAAFAVTFGAFLRKVLQDIEEYSSLLSLADPSKPDDLIEQLQISLDKREHSISSLSKTLHMRRGTLKERFEMSGHSLSLRHGRLPNRDLELLKDRVNHLHDVEGIRIGYKRTAESIAESGEEPPYWSVRRILCPCQVPKPKVKDHTHLFEAKYVDYIWHTDLHHLTSMTDAGPEGKLILYMIAFLDDCTRFIIHYEIHADKRSETAAQALANALADHHAPCVLASDNGGEFVGDAFQRVLQYFKIRFCHTAPRTPQQNGKIERFWRSLDKARGGSIDQKKIERIVWLYNHRWRHGSTGLTPEKRRQTLLHWSHVPADALDPDIMKNLTWFQ
jgi:hypothetical protein